jgi:hypothetical protein
MKKFLCFKGKKEKKEAVDRRVEDKTEEKKKGTEETKSTTDLTRSVYVPTEDDIKD